MSGTGARLGTIGLRRLRPGSTWSPALKRRVPQRDFRRSPASQIVKPYLLADIGEGIREVQIIQWFVKPGARVEQFQALCEVQSDKATVEITSRFDGIVKKLHYDADDMAPVGKALCDIDIQSEITEADAAVTEVPTEEPETQAGEASATEAETPAQSESSTPSAAPSSKSDRHKTLATPAVRHLCNEHKIDIADVPGTGKDGRVLKEDVQRFAAGQTGGSPSSAEQGSPASAGPQPGSETLVALSPIQMQMFKTMTRSLAIPHFLYTDGVDMTNVIELRKLLKARDQKISALAFIVKAVSMALNKYPVMNARIDSSKGAEKPRLVMRGSHNVGIAVDTPQGLLVPVVKSVQSLSIAEIAAEIARLSEAGREGKLTTADFSGGTITVSNVGSLGGGAVAPVIVDSQVAILGVGRTKAVPAFDDDGAIVRREECIFSWSADHRVVDGATAARCADEVKRLVELPQAMAVQLK